MNFKLNILILTALISLNGYSTASENEFDNAHTDMLADKYAPEIAALKQAALDRLTTTAHDTMAEIKKTAQMAKELAARLGQKAATTTEPFRKELADLIDPSRTQAPAQVIPAPEVISPVTPEIIPSEAVAITNPAPASSLDAPAPEVISPELAKPNAPSIITNTTNSATLNPDQVENQPNLMERFTKSTRSAFDASNAFVNTHKLEIAISTAVIAACVVGYIIYKKNKKNDKNLAADQN